MNHRSDTPDRDPLAIACSACLAPVGEQCRSTSTDEPRPEPHRMRALAAYKRLMRCPACWGVGWIGEGETIPPALDDPRMQAFLSVMREESEEGVRRRVEREGGDSLDGMPEGPGGTEPITVIENTELDRERLAGSDIELDDDERRLYEALKAKHGAAIDTTVFAAMVQDLGMRITNPAQPDSASQTFEEDASAPPESPAEVLTDKQHIERIKAETSEVIRDFLAGRQIMGGHPEYGMYMGRMTARINKAAGNVKAPDVRTVEQAEMRLNAARRLCGGA